MAKTGFGTDVSTASGASDFVANPTGTGAKTGGHDFIQNPASGSKVGAPSDASNLGVSRTQQGTNESNINKDSIPAGGKNIAIPAPIRGTTDSRKPYKLTK